MNQVILGVLLGMLLGLVLFPIGLGIYSLFKNTFERIKIKKMMKQEKFLITIDPKDYDSKAWSNKKYGNIDVDKTKIDLDNLNKMIFKKKDDTTEKVLAYLNHAKKLNLTEEQLIEEFKKKNYKEEFINEMIEEWKKI